ncbi:MAG TPA: hypothetical protein GXZ66_11005 [Clostridiaceae bacterium]|jgi:hypothetical protein|nr:hypothetical protein [Clostridiaceae bacterium]
MNKIVIFSLLIMLFVTGCQAGNKNAKGYIREDIDSYGKVAWKDEIEYKVEKQGKIYSVVDFNTVHEAIDKTIEEGGGTVYFPPGSYSIDKPIELDLPEGVKITLLGETNGHCILKGEKDIEGPVVSILSEGVSLGNLVFQSYAQEQPAVLVKGDGTRIYKCFFQGMNVRNLESTAIVAASNVSVTSCTFSNVNKEAYTLEITKFPDKEAKNIYIIDFFLNGEFNGFVINSDDENGCPENVLIQRGVFLNYNTEQLTIKSVKNLVVDNNMLDQSALYCITMNPVYKGIDNVTIKENYIAASYRFGELADTTAILVDGTKDSKITNVVITNNMIAYSVNGMIVNGNNFADSKVIDNVFQSTLSYGLKIEEAINLSIQRNSFKPDASSIGLQIDKQNDKTIVKDNF